MKRLLFLLSGNISTTPRALKSIQLALQNGYKVDVCLINRLDKWKELDKHILATLSCHVTYIPFRKEESVLIWILVGILHRLSICLAKLARNNLIINAFASSKINILYYLKLRKLCENYDMVLGYSGMFYPAFIFSKQHSIPFSFDMEDFHPGEVIYHKGKKEESIRRIKMLKCILPLASYVSYGSPLIEKKMVELLGRYNVNIPYGFPLNNTFSHSDFIYSGCNEDKVQFVWFSQTVSFGRGLDLILPALEKYKELIRLTLIGNMDNQFYQEVLLPYKDFIIVKEALPQEDLHKVIGKYDIGLALEQNVDENRTICLTNKIFTYLLAGLYVIATPTEAQKLLMAKFPDHGIVVDSTIEKMDACIKNIINNIQTIRIEKERRFKDVSTISWEYEEKKLLYAWKKNLG